MNTVGSLMKYFFAAALAGLVLTAGASAQTAAGAEKELKALQDAWAAARVKGDVAFLEKLYAKEFRITAINGAVISREQDIALFAAGEIKPEVITDDDMEVAVYGDVALVTGREYVRGSYKGHPGEYTMRFTNVYVRRDGRWQMVTTHATEVRKK